MSTFGPLRALLICPDSGMREQLRPVVDAAGLARVCFEIPRYPSGSELARALRTYSPQFVVLSFEDLEKALAVTRYLEAEASGLPVVALHAVADRTALLCSMRAGVREFLTPPFSEPQVEEVVTIVRGALHHAPLSFTATDHIYSFLPAKPGVGATTVAMNAAAAFARIPETRVLLADLDVACGIVRFLWKLPHELSIVDALNRASDMDTALWPQLVSTRERVEILHSGGINPHAYLEPPQVQGLIDFARSNYSALFFDMSGNFERHTIQVMQESKRVFLVCNPESTSLYLAHEKLAFFRDIGVEGRVSLLLNRADQELALPLAQVEAFLGLPVAGTFPENVREVSRAQRAACSVFDGRRGRESVLVQQYDAFARALFRGGHGPPLQEPLPDPAPRGVRLGLEHARLSLHR